MFSDKKNTHTQIFKCNTHVCVFNIYIDNFLWYIIYCIRTHYIIMMIQLNDPNRYTPFFPIIFSEHHFFAHI